MYNKPCCGMFLDMGLGKTVISLSVLWQLMYVDFSVRRCLVIAPLKVAQSVWEQEAKEWEEYTGFKISKVLGTEKQRKAALAVNADVYVINRENVVWLCNQYGGNFLPFDMLIIDELSSFKNHSSQRFKALSKAAPSVPRRVGLTGTPSPNGLINLWSELYLLDLGERLGKNITSYRNEYFNSKDLKAGSGGQYTKYTPRKGASDEILAKISDICISMSTKDVGLELPPRYDNIIKVELSPGARRTYDEMEKNLIIDLVNDYITENAESYYKATGKVLTFEQIQVTALNAAALSNKLLQISNGAIYHTDIENGRKEAVFLHDEKLERLDEIVEELDGKPLLIAYSFIHDKDRILKRYKGARVLKTDKDVKDWNAGKIPIALVHPASAGHGLNLQFGGSTALWYGLPWDLELYEQFNKRLHRSGQKHNVIIHHLLCRNTEDERVLQSLLAKTDVQNGVFESLSYKLEKYKNLF